MPPPLALVISFAFTYWLIRTDKQERPKATFAYWIVLLWFMIRASRPVTSWLGGVGSGDSDADGNAAEAAILLIFIVCAIGILNRRGFSLTSLPRLNLIFFILFLYLGLSCLWSPYGFVSFKRLIKEFGSICVALVIITEVNPAQFLRSICVRAAYFLFPLSIALIKYFPHLGRAYSPAGEAMVTGVTTQKNSLGIICCILLIALIWDIAETWRRGQIKTSIKGNSAQLIAILLGAWLLWDSQSKTSLLTAIIGISVLAITGFKITARIPRTVALTIFFSTATTLLIVGISTTYAAPLLEALGRDATLTGRTDIWRAALAQPVNPLIGTGYFIFWNEFGPDVWAHFRGNFFVRSVHSGYIEMYLDGGAIGVTLLIALILYQGLVLSARIRRHDLTSRACFSILIVFMTANFSESYSFRFGPLWFVVVTILLSSGRLTSSPTRDITYYNHR